MNSEKYSFICVCNSLEILFPFFLFGSILEYQTFVLFTRIKKIGDGLMVVNSTESGTCRSEEH